MKNSVVKLFALILSAFSYFYLCLDVIKNSAQAEENIEATVNGTTVREIDMEGYTFKIAQWWDASSQ